MIRLTLSKLSWPTVSAALRFGSDSSGTAAGSKGLGWSRAFGGRSSSPSRTMTVRAVATGRPAQLSTASWRWTRRPPTGSPASRVRLAIGTVVRKSTDSRVRVCSGGESCPASRATTAAPCTTSRSQGPTAAEVGVKAVGPSGTKRAVAVMARCAADQRTARKASTVPRSAQVWVARVMPSIPTSIGCQRLPVAAVAVAPTQP